MSQQEVYDYLKSHSRRFYSMKELKVAIGISANALSMNLLRMMNAGEVDKRVVPFRTTRGSARQYSYRLR